MILLTEERIKVSDDLKQYLTDQAELNNNLSAFISKEIEFLNADIDAYELIKKYYDFFDVSFMINEGMRRKINDLLAESLTLEAEAFLILQEIIKEYELDHLLQ